MFKSILTTALRNIVRNRSFSLINLAGLSFSMSLALLVIIVVKEQYTYDNFHSDSDRIYRVNTRALRVQGGAEEYASTPLPIASALKQEYTFAENVIRMNSRLNADAVYGNVNVPIEGLFVDPEFLQIFNFALEKGNPATALSDPKNLVLTKSAAKKIFGERDPLGQSLTLKGYGEFVVAGVMKEFAGKTHLEFGVLGSMTAVPALEQHGIISPSVENWNNYYSNYVYVKLKPGRKVEALEGALRNIYKKYYTGLKLELRDRGYEFYIQPLGKITPGPELSNQMGRGMPDMVLMFLGVLAAVVMVMACFNYTNLMIAKSLSRAREIGVRKVVGAQRFQVFLQFIGESVIFSLISLCFAYLLLQFLKPVFMELNIANEFSADLPEDYSIAIYFVLFAVAVGCFGGLLPAGYLSAFRPEKVLKDRGNVKVYSKLTFRKVLIITQFTLSIVFIITVLVIYRQVNFMVNKDYGIHEKDVLDVRLQGMEFDKLAAEVKNLPGVISVGGVSHALGTWADRSSEYKLSRDDQPFVMRDFIVNDAYIRNLDLEFVAGSNFEEGQQRSHERHVILNERALEFFAFPNAVAAIGQPVYADDSLLLTVVGVVKDFHFRPLNYQIGPLALRYKTSELNILSAKIAPGAKDAVIASLENIWKRLDPVHPLEWKMMEDVIDDAYVQSGFQDILKIVGYISFLAVMLACLGILGMAMYSTKTRMKEIGVRKVMGATSTQITLLLSNTFLGLLAIAAVIGTPAGYFIGEMFLTTYAYKIDITPWLMLTGICIVAICGILMVGSQTWKAASANPVRSLRYE
jgi:putative ABC transport system permease protein